MNKHKIIILLLALTGAFVTVLDTGILYTGTVKLANDLKLNNDQLSWVQVAYILTYAGFMLLGGKLGDIYGRRNLFILGLCIFSVFSLMVGISTNATMIIISRTIQGIGAAILQPTCLAIITDTFKGKELQKSIGYYAAVIGAGAVIGIAFGGFCAEYISWRSGFIINAPLSLIMGIISFKVLTNNPNKKIKLDWIGNILSVVAMISLTYGITSNRNSIGIILISMLSWIAFLYSQAKVNSPMMPLVIFRNKQRLGSYIGSLLFSAAGVIFWFYIPQFMQIQFHYNAMTAALAMIPMSIVLLYFSIISGKIIEKIGGNVVLLLGLVLVLLSALGLSICHNTENFWLIFPFTLSFGIGFALTLTPLTTSAMYRISSNNRGVASGVYNTTRQFGAAIGLALGLSVSKDVYIINGIFRNVMILAAVLIILGIIFIMTLVTQKEISDKRV
ncbi:MFS transporter [Staphylococcus simulans]